MTPTTAIVPILLALCSLGSAEKDSDYYLPGYSNPNIHNKMYWKDSINILQDLDQFESLYITYHHCVWSKYGTRYGSGQDYDEQDNGDGEDFGNGCGGYGGEFFWYMGRTQCFKANAAYSLYGILKGSNVPNNPCSKRTYINSFFTTFGAESFTGPLGLGVDSVNSQCTETEPEQMYLDDDQAAADDDYLDDNFQFYNYKAYTSSGTGCRKGNFVADTYQGAFCHGRNYMETTNTLDTVNEMLKGMQCTEIYNANNYNDDQNGGRRLEDDTDFENMDPIDILSYSKSCSLRQYPNDCPDPHGLKSQYALSSNLWYQVKTGQIWDRVVTMLTWIGVGVGVLALLLSVLIPCIPAAKKNTLASSIKRKREGTSTSRKKTTRKQKKKKQRTIRFFGRK